MHAQLFSSYNYLEILIILAYRLPKLNTNYKNMRIILLFLAVCAILKVNSQEITIEKSAHPYFDIIEWKGMGGILMSKDPTGNNKQINLTLVGSQPESIWDQKFTPRNEEYYFISSENARYVYFLHNLDLEDGKVFFSQLNSAGNVKTTSVSLGAALKKLGDLDSDELELRNVVVTDKALVHQFRYHDKKGETYREFATFMTHHNMLLYAVELGSIPEELIKNGQANHWRYIGFDGDKICFASQDRANKKNHWAVNIYTSKGELLDVKSMDMPNNNFASFINIGFGTTGAFHLKNNTDRQSGLLTFHNNNFYASGIAVEKNQSILTLLELKDGNWTTIAREVIESLLDKKSIQLGVYPLNEGLGYHVISSSGDHTTLLKYDGDTAISNPFTPKTVYNPSRILVEENKKLFAVTLPDGILFFNLDELKAKSNVHFEFKAK